MADHNQHINYSITDIEQYLQGRMSAKEMHALEKAALQDPFLADALEGYRIANSVQSKQHLNEITAAVQAEKQTAKIKSFSQGKRGWMRIAAIVMVIIGAGIIGKVLWNKNFLKESTVQIAKNEVLKPPKEDTLKPAEENGITKNDNKNKPAPEEKSGKILAYKNPEVKLKKQTNTTAQSQESLKVFAPELSPDKAIASRAPHQEMRMMRTAPSSINDSLQNNEKFAPAPHSTPEVILMMNAKSVSDLTLILPQNDSIPAPETGWKIFQQNIYTRLEKENDSTLLNTGKQIIIQFSFSEKGLPVNFKAGENFQDAASMQLINLLKTGPHWISTALDKQITLRFQF